MGLPGDVIHTVVILHTDLQDGVLKMGLERSFTKAVSVYVFLLFLFVLVSEQQLCRRLQEKGQKDLQANKFEKHYYIPLQEVFKKYISILRVLRNPAVKKPTYLSTLMGVSLGNAGLQLPEGFPQFLWVCDRHSECNRKDFQQSL